MHIPAYNGPTDEHVLYNFELTANLYDGKDVLSKLYKSIQAAKKNKIPKKIKVSTESSYVGFTLVITPLDAHWANAYELLGAELEGHDSGTVKSSYKIRTYDNQYWYCELDMVKLYKLIGGKKLGFVAPK